MVEEAPAVAALGAELPSFEALTDFPRVARANWHSSWLGGRGG